MCHAKEGEQVHAIEYIHHSLQCITQLQASIPCSMAFRIVPKERDI